MKVLATTLAAALAITGSAVAFAADRNGRQTPNGTSGFQDKTLDDPHRRNQQRIDPDTTGSIVRCDTQLYDEDGNCVVDPGMQDIQ